MRGRLSGHLGVAQQPGKDPRGTGRVGVVDGVYTGLGRDLTIERGENAGKTVTYRNIVTSWTVLGEWDGAAPYEAEAEVAGPERAAVIVQAAGPAGVLAAARAD